MEQLNILVERTLASGVAPIEQQFTPVYDPYGEENVALVAHGVVNSVLYGTLTDDDLAAIAETDAGCDYFVRMLSKACDTLSRLRAKGKPVKWIALRCPLAALAPHRLDEVEAAIPDKRLARGICLVLPAEVITDKAYAHPVGYLRSVGYKVAVGGYGTPAFPMLALTQTDIDVVFAPVPDDLLSRVDGTSAVSALVGFATNLGIDVVTTDVANDSALRGLRSADVFGVTVSPYYNGTTMRHLAHTQTVAEVLADDIEV